MSMLSLLRRTSLLAGLLGLGIAGGAAAQGAFGPWDKDGDGRLDRAEFEGGPAGLSPAAARGETPQPAPGPGVRYTLSDFDLDGDGLMSREEFAYGAGEAGLGDEFEDWDADASGGIDASEYAAGYARSGPAPAALGVDQERRAAEARYDFANWDSNADGRIDEAEFAGIRREFNLLETLSAFDANADGALDAAEYASLPRRTTFTAGAAPGDEPHFRFETFDLDADGFIGPDEYAAFERERLQRSTGRLIDVVDTDGDGRVSRGEYEAFAASAPRWRNAGEPPLFGAFDRNDDGALDVTEMAGLQNALERF